MDDELRRLERLENTSTFTFEEALDLDIARVRAGIPLSAINDITKLDRTLRRIIQRMTGGTKHPTYYLGDFAWLGTYFANQTMAIAVYDRDDKIACLLARVQHDRAPRRRRLGDLPSNIRFPDRAREELVTLGIFSFIRDSGPHLFPADTIRLQGQGALLEWATQPALDRLITTPWTIDNWKRGNNYRRRAGRRRR